MQRRRQVWPDQELELRDGRALPYVSLEALQMALADAATVVDFAGGVLELVVDRAPTDLPGEMVTTAAVIQWKDRTDSRPQPEVPTAEAFSSIPVPSGQEPASESPEPASSEPDGFDMGALEEEDLSDIPVEQR